MARKIFCDDCGKVIKLQEKVEIGTWVHSLEMCYTCFSNHWKPINKKFIFKDYREKI
ncbi:hypothetical protein HYW54_05435 [Candidatus Gottesmanbacteria bacterium]|nr:hypothetical protein [Candidatus Gottesmanbacteria bacterium]